jgi:hypothetical protein
MNIGGANMANGERSGSGGQGDWPIKLATALGVLAGGSIALLWRPEFFSGPFWLGMLGFLIFVVVGGVLGKFVGWLLFRPSSGGPTNPPPPA